VQRLLSLLLNPKKLLKIIGAGVGSVLYVWIAAVRAVPTVRRRKAALRAAWRRRHAERREAELREAERARRAGREGGDS
jgi:hypothetical protein